MPRPRVEGQGGVADLVPGGAVEEEEEEGEAVAPTIITLVRDTATEGVVATQAFPRVLGVGTEAEVEEVVMERRSRAMGKWTDNSPFSRDNHMKFREVKKIVIM